MGLMGLMGRVGWGTESRMEEYGSGKTAAYGETESRKQNFQERWLLGWIDFSFPVFLPFCFGDFFCESEVVFCSVGLCIEFEDRLVFDRCGVESHASSDDRLECWYLLVLFEEFLDLSGYIRSLVVFGEEVAEDGQSRIQFCLDASDVWREFE